MTWHRWEDNSKMDLPRDGLGRHGLDECGSGYRQVAGTCQCGNEHAGITMWLLSH